MLAGLIGSVDADFRVGKGRNVFRDGIVEDSLPSSTSIIAATDVMAFDIE